MIAREGSENRQIADRLRQFADMLQAQNANPFRVLAYRRAADTIDAAPPLRALYVGRGRDGLDALPGVGPGIAGAVAEMLDTGRWSQLERLKGTLDPVALFQTVPGIGPELAARLHDRLGMDTLEALEIACHDGRVRDVPGLGVRRAAAIGASLAEILGRGRIRRLRDESTSPEPGVDVLLDVDREYREAARDDRLPRVAPRRFNPDHAAWLPVLHTMRGPWHFTALFSNTARAHDRMRTHDWVVLYFHAAGEPERQRTVVTEAHGRLAGHRVVRGREAECLAWHRPSAAA